MRNNEIVLTSIESYNTFVSVNKSALVYFSTQGCNVCKVLKPKVKELLTREFPNMKFAYADTNNGNDLAAQNSIFTVPSIVIYFDGKEFKRVSRSISIQELSREIARPYSLINQ